jgi:type IV pilus assembly protein PilM
MPIFSQLLNFIEDPPPAYAFEISQAGIAWARRPQKKGQSMEIQFQAFAEEVLAISPVKDNVLLPDAFQRLVLELAPPNGARRPRGAALILPDYCARVALLDFESFPSQPAEQLSLVRFRLKKTMPFDLESAAVSFQVREKRDARKYEVLVTAAAMEIIARYEAPFRAAGLQPGFTTTSMLATMDLLPKDGLFMSAKLSGQTLTVAVCEGRYPRLLRCVELPELSLREVMAVLYPTVAYAEDELPQRPTQLFAAGFGSAADTLRAECERELSLSVEPMRSRWGTPGENNAGLLGFLQAQEAAA